MSQHFQIETRDDKIQVVSFKRNDIDANALNESVLLELSALLKKIASDNQCKGVVFKSTRPKQFIAGADISEIEKMRSVAHAAEGARRMQAVLTQIEQLKVPTAAAIHGACLGGGLEFALACRYRVVSSDSSTVLGLPEIQLGLIPGAGGTQRLPRLIGIAPALDMILTGRRVKAERCVKMGLADAVVHENQLLDVAMDLVKKAKPRKHPKKSLMVALLEGNVLGRTIMKTQALTQVKKSAKGFYPAPLKALDVVFCGIGHSLARGLEIEAQAFGQLAMTPQSQSLIHLFHATTAIKKNKFADDVKKIFADSNVESVGIIGAGFMGTGIATVCVDKDIRVRMSDPSKIALGRTLSHVREFFRKKLKRKQIKPFEMEKKVASISPATSPQGFQSCDVVIEAVFEDLALKQKLLKECEKGAPSHWIFASNTSALPIGKIAAVSSHPERVLGMHFFSPVEKMPLLEIIVTDKTAKWATGRAIGLGQTMGKQVIVVQDGPGFYTTRALAFFLYEAALLLNEGTPIDALDHALTSFGFPVGPITLIDEVGIDVGIHVLETMHTAFPDRVAVPAALSKIIKSGRLGRKNQKGFYLYKDGKKLGPDPEIYNMLDASQKSINSTLTKEDLVKRCVLSFVNESIRCLEEGILSHPYDGDVGAVFGLGFPPFLGGPFKYVDTYGAANAMNDLKNLEQKFGSRFRAAQLLCEYAKDQKRFFPDERA